ncbi:MAG: STAS domain-containing protein [Methylobacter sp.]|jgi:ABC-type transporter Mla MlaB component|nr:STAS domain-containing protein [Methylobacter sp.]
MATSEENDLIGYDPLAWMEGGADKNEALMDDDAQQECQLIDAESSITDNYADDVLENVEEDSTLSALNDAEDSVAEEDLSIIDESEDEGDSVIMDETVAEDSATEEADSSQVDLDATLTIQHVVNLHEKLKQVLAAHDQIEINASDVASIDTATLQLLVSLKKDAVKLQKTVSIIYPSPRFVESARLLGLSDVLDVHDV